MQVFGALGVALLVALVVLLGMTIRSAYYKSIKPSQEVLQDAERKGPEIWEATKSAHIRTFQRRPDDMDTGQFTTIPTPTKGPA
jgi:hypothetical protein